MESHPTLIDGKLQDLGDGLTVRRLLPVLQARHVGPMVFSITSGRPCSAPVRHGCATASAHRAGHGDLAV